MRILRCVMGKKMIDKSRTDKIRRKGVVRNTLSEKIREAGLRWVGQLEINTQRCS